MTIIIVIVVVWVGLFFVVQSAVRGGGGGPDGPDGAARAPYTVSPTGPPRRLPSATRQGVTKIKVERVPNPITRAKNGVFCKARNKGVL